MTHHDSYEINRANWDERAPAHALSPDYRVQDFLTDPGFLSDVVRFDLPRLGQIAGLRGIHLQCHIGTDTLSLHRLGARMTGLDFSGASLEQARSLAGKVGAQIDYVLADTYSAPTVVPREAFDLVYTGIGALCWLPDIERWAQVVASLLAPGGTLFVREGHPMLWALDSDGNGAITVRYPYFEHSEPLVFDEDDSYVTTEAPFSTTTTHSWNHGLGEIIGALMRHGLQLTHFEEHTTIPWQGLQEMVRSDIPGEYVLPNHADRVAMSYTLVARKP